ncbi:unnamed protein product, partial [Iphiclides podalirius]
MESKKEYHDPDYPETSGSTQEGVKSLSEEEKLEKIKNIVRKEFGNELDIRENEVMLADQRMLTARRALHHLRYTLVNNYYKQQKLQLSASQLEDELTELNEPRSRAEVSSLLRDGQREIHPSLRKLLGKKTVDLEEIFKIREPRNKARKDYLAMLQTRNYTVPADSTKSLRPESQQQEIEPFSTDVPEKLDRPKKVPRHLEPKITNVVTLDEATRNKMKHRYRIIIGNTSKYAPGASRADRSTHTWLLYVRGAEAVLRAVAVRLHHSYAPHHLVRLERPPFSVARRGWGEFPARVELHFALPERNRPAAVDHTIRLDRHCTGLQTLGAETVVDVWLYSTAEMLEHEYKENIPVNPPLEAEEANEADKTEAASDDAVPNSAKDSNDIRSNKANETNNTEKLNDSWLEFFSKDTTELNVDEMLVKDVKSKAIETNDIEPTIDGSFVTNKSDECKGNESVITDMREMDDFKICSPTEQLPTELVNQDTCLKKRIMKYMDPTTRKIYYLEMDRDLDLSKVQEIVINSQGQVQTAKISPIKSNGLKHVRKTKGGASLTKPETKGVTKKEVKNGNHRKLRDCYAHIENDHCYLATPQQNSESEDEDLPMDSPTHSVGPRERNLYEGLCAALLRFPCVRMAVNYLLKNIPLISVNATNEGYVKYFPFVVESEERYWKLDFAKRRNIEWSRAKLINKLLIENLKTDEPIWRTKQILIYSRMHGFFPIRPDNIPQHLDKSTEDWSTWKFGDDFRIGEGGRSETCSTAGCNTLTIFDIDEYLGENSPSESFNQSDSDEDIDIVMCETKVKVKSEVVPESSLEVLPVESEEDRLRFLFIEKKCADIGIELRNEDVGNGYAYSAVHAVLLSAMRSLAEELLRSSLASLHQETHTPPLVWASGARRRSVGTAAVLGAVQAVPRLRLLTSRGLGAERRRTQPL